MPWMANRKRTGPMVATTTPIWPQDQIDLNGGAPLTNADLFNTAALGMDDTLIDDTDANPGAPQIVVTSINSGADLEIDFGNGNVLTLLGVSSLNPGDDIFV
jgi:hypothetical protein